MRTTMTRVAGDAIGSPENPGRIAVGVTLRMP